MNTRMTIILIALLTGGLLAACGPSGPSPEQQTATAAQAAANLKEQQDATATQAAANIYATLTAQAPTVTPTFTPSPTATATPTSTPTPKPTSTSTPTVTPTPGLESAGLTLDDLPDGFVAMLPEEIGIIEKAYSPGSKASGFRDFVSSQGVVGVLIPVSTRAGQARFDANMTEQANAEAKGGGCATSSKKLSGFESIGDRRAAITGVGKNANLTMRCDVVVFRRGEVGVILFYYYPDGDQLAVTTLDLASLVDERIQHYAAVKP